MNGLGGTGAQQSKAGEDPAEVAIELVTGQLKAGEKNIEKWPFFHQS